MRKTGFEAILIALIAFGTLCLTFGISHFSVFQARDLARAAALAHGSLIFWGPETTGGGNLPGPFYYWLLSIPYLFHLGWHGAWYLMIALYSGAAALIWIFLKPRGTVAAALGVAFFLSSGLLLRMLKSFWNPSFLFLFVILDLIGLCFTFSRERASSKAWLWTGLALGLTIQIHLSLIAMVSAAIALQMLSRRLGLRTLPRGTFVLGLLALLLTLAPFGIWKAASWCGYSIGQMPPLSSGHLRDSLAAVVTQPANLVEKLSFESGNTVKEPNFGLRIPMITGRFLPFAAWILLLFGLAGAIARSRFSPRRMAGRFREAVALLDGDQKVIAICCLFTFIPALLLYVLPYGHRYALGFGISIILFLAMTCHKWLRRSLWPLALLVFTSYAVTLTPWARDLISPPALLALVSICLLFAGATRELGKSRAAAITVLLGGAVLSPFAAIGLTDDRATIPINTSSSEVANYIYGRTGWDYDQVRRRTLFLFVHRESDLEYLYRDVMKGKTVPHTANKPDGFVVLNPPDDNVLYWLKKGLPLEFLKELKSGILKVTDTAQFGRLYVLSFNWTQDAGSDSPDSGSYLSFGNVGYPNTPALEDSFLNEINRPFPGVKKLAGNEVAFYWNDCPTADYGKSAIRVQVLPHDLRVSVLGRALSQASPWIFPLCTEGWQGTYLTYKCDGETHRIVLAESIGLLKAEPPIVNRTFLTPFTRDIRLDCRKPVNEISAGREYSYVNHNGRVEKSEPQTLAAELEIPVATK